MIKEAIDKIIELRKPTFHEADGKTFSDKAFCEIKEAKHRPDAIQVNTLSGLIEYCNNNLDDAKSYLVSVADYRWVCVYGEYQEEFAERNHYLTAEAPTFNFIFGKFYDMETFNIFLQTQFFMNDNLAAALSVAGGIQKDEAITHKDDGFTQNVTVKTGVAKVEYADVPNPIKLIPLRTFPEIDSPETLFVLRCRRGSQVPEFALFESDGGKWKTQAIQRIGEYLRTNLEGIGKDIHVIA